MAEEKAKNRANDVVVVGDSIQDFSHVGALINEYDFLAGYSNSQLKYQNLTLPLKIGWSIDRITIVGKLKDNILWDGRILVDFERLMRLNEDSGYLVALSPNSWKIIDKYKENIAYIEMSKFQKGYGRIDFNPNKVNEFISLGMKKFIHKLFLEPHFSRADVACDIVDVPDDFILVLCSDGLSGYCTDEEIKTVLLNSTFEESADELIKLAISKGGRDNVTVALVAK